MIASAACAKFLLKRFQPGSESAIYGADFSRRNSTRGNLAQYPALMDVCFASHKLTYDRFWCETHVLRRKFAKVQIDVAAAVPTLTILGDRD